ncbi:hypothetical protein [Ruminococcus sp.]|uniref:pullulanase X25 domain-containing protein n=1 Tax=Ruminococcus sp. TaxID=41978 RepID=UPI001B0CF009|nr:hypothetical protein [Ruminococcus sp.]MBO5559286.1 hypothetical protein [Ruminococcus sp.]
MKNAWKKSITFALALTLVTGFVPANVGTWGAFGGAGITVSAEDVDVLKEFTENDVAYSIPVSPDSDYSAKCGKITKIEALIDIKSFVWGHIQTGVNADCVVSDQYSQMTDNVFGLKKYVYENTNPDAFYAQVLLCGEGQLIGVKVYYSDSETDVFGRFDVPEFDAPTAVKGLWVDGNEHELVVPPKGIDAELVEYSTDNITWSNEIPKGEEAGDYTVYYRIRSGNDVFYPCSGKDGIKVSIAHDLYVAGNGASGNPWVNGESWNVASAENKMTYADGIYTISYPAVPAGEGYEFKFAQDGTWDVSYGYPDTKKVLLNEWLDIDESTGNDSNISFDLDKTSDITISFDSVNSRFMIEAVAVDNVSDYTLTIPASFDIKNEGWNEIGDISVTGKLADSRKLVVNAESDGEFALVNQSDNTQKIDYTLKNSAEGEETTSWEFEELSETPATQKIGVDVAPFKGMPAGSYTDTVTFTASVEDAVNIVDLSALTADYEAQNGDILTGTLKAGVKISIADGATVTLKDANITNLGNGCDWAGINCPNDATIILKGTNTICAGRDGDGYNNYPGIWIASGKTLTIDGDGSLTASSNDTNPSGAGIGGGYKVNCGNIVINGGTITATGGDSAAGIGGGADSSCGNITINGGTITATGGNYAAGIGSGNRVSSNTSCGNITIANTVTKVTATKGKYDTDAHSIGAGGDGVCGKVTIGGVEGAISKSPYTYQP